MINVLYLTGFEIKKITKAKSFIISMILFLLIPIIGAMSIYILKDKGNKETFGFLYSTLKNLYKANWNGYFKFMLQSLSTVGIVIFGFISYRIFSFEYKENTVQDILINSKAKVAITKFISIFIIIMFISIISLLLMLGIGSMMHFKESKIIFNGILSYLICAIVVIIVSYLSSFIAVISRKYLMLFIYFVTVVIVSVGMIIIDYGEYFPYSFPLTISNLESNGMILYSKYVLIGFIIIFVVFLGAIIGTINSLGKKDLNKA